MDNFGPQNAFFGQKKTKFLFFVFAKSKYLNISPLSPLSRVANEMTITERTEQK